MDIERTFLAIAEHGSLSKAADSLNVSKSTVSNRLAELESRLGTPLVVRGARGLVLTESGTAYHRHIKITVDLTDEAESLVRSMSSGAAGEISLNVPPGLMEHWLAKPVAEFIHQHSDLRMNIVTTDRPLNGLGKDIDLGFHWGELPDSQLHARRVFHDEIIFVAGSGYASNHTLDLKSADIEFLQLPKNYAGESQKRIAASGEAWWVYQMPSRVTANSIEVLVALLNENAGISLLPKSYVKSQINAGLLVDVTATLQQKPFSMWCYAVTLNRPIVGSRVHRLIDAVVKTYANR